MPGPLLTRAQWLNLASTGARAGAALAMQKLVALRYGPPGVAELGQFILVQSLCYAVLTDGLNRAMMVEAGQASDRAHRLAVLARGGMAAAALMACLALPAWAGMGWLLPGAAPFALPLALAIGAGGWYWWAAATLQFEDFPAAVAWLSVAWGGILVAGAAWPEAFLPGFLPRVPAEATGMLPRRLLLVALGQAALGLGAGGVYQLRLRRSAGAALGAPTGLLRKIGVYGGFSLAVLVAGRGAEVAVRAYVMHLGLWQQLGLWQAAVRLGDTVFVPLTPLFTVVFFARAAQLPVPELRQALRPQLKLALLGTAGIGLVVAIAPWALAVLNRADFGGAAAYYYRQAPGDVCRLLALPVSVALLAAGRIRASVWLEGVSLVSYGLAVFALGRWQGVMGLALAHSVRYVVFLAATLYAARDLLWHPKPRPGLESNHD